MEPAGPLHRLVELAPRRVLESGYGSPVEPPDLELGAATPGQPTIRPLQVDGVAAVAVGTAMWCIALAVTLALRSRLELAGTDWWIWVAVTGSGLGFLGLGYVLRRRSVYATAEGSPQE